MNTHPQKQTRPTKLSMIKSIIQAFKDHPLSSKPHHGEEDCPMLGDDHHDPYSPEDEPHTTSDHHDLMNSQLEDEALELEVLTITDHTWTLELPGEDAQVCTFPVSDDPRFNITTIMCGSLLVTIQEAGE